MKLHTFYIPFTVSKPHDRLLLALLVLGPGSDLEALWQRLSVDHKAVITGRRQWAGEISKHPLAVVVNLTGLAMQDRLRPHHLATKRGANALLTKCRPCLLTLLPSTLRGRTQT